MFFHLILLLSSKTFLRNSYRQFLYTIRWPMERAGFREVSIVCDNFHWWYHTAMDDGLHVLMADEDRVYKHLNKVQKLVKNDQVDLMQEWPSGLDDYSYFIQEIYQEWLECATAGIIMCSMIFRTLWTEYLI